MSWPTMQTKDLNAFLKNLPELTGPVGELFGKDEKDAMSSFIYLASIITERAALLSASIVAAAVEKAGGGFDPLAPVRIAVEGTTYLIYTGMRKALESRLHDILNKDKPRFYVIAPVEKASLLGAAVAALHG